MGAKKFILVTKKSVADEICDELGTNYMLNNMGNDVAYCFLYTDKLHTLLSDKRRFSKRDWCPYNGTLNF